MLMVIILRTVVILRIMAMVDDDGENGASDSGDDDGDVNGSGDSDSSGDDDSDGISRTAVGPMLPAEGTASLDL